MKKTVTVTVTLTLLLLLMWPSEGLPYSQIRTLISLSSSLMHRVGNARDARGDVGGAQRARRIAEGMESWGGLGLGGGVWRVGWDYVWNYAWRGGVGGVGELGGVVADVTDLLSLLHDLTQSWSDRGYQRALLLSYIRIWLSLKRFTKSLLKANRKTNSSSGAIREVVMVIKREVEGDLLKDCIEVGIGDLKGLAQVVKDMALQFSRQNNLHENSDL
ncbi:hypothetical protein Sjap_000663 [Stephania japonica]|uniref:Uncharacterized protein n=1 Tax=Stephania japonica TaxID=461633 RepID=A0AAP0KK36_9MAGN